MNSTTNKRNLSIGGIEYATKFASKAKPFEIFMNKSVTPAVLSYKNGNGEVNPIASLTDLINIQNDLSALEATVLNLEESGDILADEVTNLQTQVNALTPANQLLSGGVVYSGTGLVYDVSALIYKILDVTYTSNPISLTLTASDPTDPRIDVIYADAQGVVGYITGTPDVNPIKPIVDNSTQLELTFVTIAANATTPSISIENVYNENLGTPTEWAGTTNGSVNFASTNNPYSGTVSIETTAILAGGKWIKLTPLTAYTINGGALSFKMKAKANMSGNGGKLLIGFYNAGVLVGNTVQIGGSVSSTFGFVGSNTTDYQSVVIDISNFGALPSTVSELRLYRQGGGSTVNFFLDDVSIQEIPTTPVASSIGLASVLAVSNTTGGKNIVLDETDDVVFKRGVYTTNINTESLTANRDINFPNKNGTVALTSDLPSVTTKSATLSVTQDNLSNLAVITHESSFTNAWSISEFVIGGYEIINTGAFTDVSKLYISGQVIAEGSSDKIVSMPATNAGREIIGHINLERGDNNSLLLLCFNTSGNQTSLYNLIGGSRLCLPEIKVYP